MQQQQRTTTNNRQLGLLILLKELAGIYIHVDWVWKYKHNKWYKASYKLDDCKIEKKKQKKTRRRKMRTKTYYFHRPMNGSFGVLP